MRDTLSDRHAALLRAIANHDTVDLAAELPARITLDYQPELLERCYRLSLDLWRDVDRRRFAALARHMIPGRPLSASDASAFKDIRARAKQVRFVHGALGREHVYPTRLDRLTRLMGKAQDALKLGRRGHAAFRGGSIRFLLALGEPALGLRELEEFEPTTASGLAAFLRGDVARIAAELRKPGVTNQAFHEMRKIVSRLVAFYDTLTVLQPSAYHDAVDRYLGTINGLMGAMHDDMVLRKATSRRDYRGKPEPLPEQIAERLHRLIAAFDAG